jgi:hypothetical protein
VVNFLQFCCNHALEKKNTLEKINAKQMQETAPVSDFYFIFLELASSGGRRNTHQTLSANFLAIYIYTP